MKTPLDFLTLLLLLNLTRPMRQLPLLLINTLWKSMMQGVLVWLILLGSVLAVLDYEARTARSSDWEEGQQAAFQDESQPARRHLTPIHLNTTHP